MRSASKRLTAVFRGLWSCRFLGCRSVIFGSHCLLIHTSHGISKHVHPSFFFFFLQLSLRPDERNNILCWFVSLRGENEHFFFVFFFFLKKQTNLCPKIANYSLFKACHTRCDESWRAMGRFTSTVSHQSNTLWWGSGPGRSLVFHLNPLCHHYRWCFIR